jgi:hypothetical protein
MNAKETPERVCRPAIPALPPDEVLAEVAAAAVRVDELRARGRSFHFEREPETGRVTAELRYLGTSAAYEVPLSSVLTAISGDAPNI